MSELFLTPAICSIVDCNKEATVIDAMDNFLCSECMEHEIDESGTEPEDYESIQRLAKGWERSDPPF